MQFEQERVKVWDLPLRIFHWTLVVAIALALLSSEEGSGLNRWHVLSGWIAGILIVFRFIWGFVGGEHSRFSDFIRPSRIGGHVSGLVGGRREASLGHNPLGAVAVVILLALTAGAVLTGAFGGEAAEELHEILGWTLLAMVGIHVLAVIVMSRLERESLVRAMVTGTKPAARHPGAHDAKSPTLIGLAFAIVAVAVTVYAVLQFDPDAFTLRSAESFEHRSEARGNASYEEIGEHEYDD